MSLFRNFAERIDIETSGDEGFYEIVTNELMQNKVIPSLWTKALAESEFDENKSKSRYIKLRVAQLKKYKREVEEYFALSEEVSNIPAPDQENEIIERRKSEYDSLDQELEEKTKKLKEQREVAKENIRDRWEKTDAKRNLTLIAGATISVFVIAFLYAAGHVGFEVSSGALIVIFIIALTIYFSEREKYIQKVLEEEAKIRRDLEIEKSIRDKEKAYNQYVSAKPNEEERQRRARLLERKKELERIVEPIFDFGFPTFY